MNPNGPFLVGRGAGGRRLGEAEALTDATIQKALSMPKAVIYFWSPSCPYCVAYKPIFKEVSDLQAGKVYMASLNVNEADASAKKYNIQGIPATIFLVNGQEVNRIEGSMTKEDLQAEIRKAFGGAGAMVSAPSGPSPVSLIFGGLAIAGIIGAGIYLFTKK